MPDPKEPSYTFHASAFASQGQITRPFDEVLEVQAEIKLPSVGGYGSARAENYRYRDLISFDRAYSVVTGSSSSDGNSHETLVMVAIERLNIMNMVTADRVVGRLTSSYKKAAKPEEQQEQHLLPVGSYFVNLQIAGNPVSVRSNAVIQCAGGFSDLMGQGNFLKQDDGSHCASIFDPFVDGFYSGVLKKPAEAKLGCAIHIRGFGTIILGQYIVKRDSRTLTMIECRLGCAVEGIHKSGDLQGNGIPG